MTIIGQTNKEAILAANYPIVNKPTIENDGSFYLTLELPLPVKAYDIVISASTKGKEQHLEKLIVIQQLDEKRYIQEAVEITANEWNDSSNNNQDNIVEIEGNIVEITGNTEEKVSLILNMGHGNTKEIMVEYYGETQLNVGLSYQFYGYIVSKKNKPILISHVGVEK